VQREGKCKERKERGYFPAERGKVQRGVSAKRGRRGVISLQREGKCRKGVSAESGYFSAGK
jgi:hypothetical protein